MMTADAEIRIKGTVVEGTFKCKKNEENSRELVVEIHYRVSKPDGPAPLEDSAIVQIFTVR